MVLLPVFFCWFWLFSSFIVFNFSLLSITLVSYPKFVVLGCGFGGGGGFLGSTSFFPLDHLYLNVNRFIEQE